MKSMGLSDAPVHLIPAAWIIFTWILTKKGVRFKMVYGDLNDASSLNRIIRTIKPDEIYNLGAQSHVKVSFEIPEYTVEVVAMGTTRLLEAIRDSGIKTKFY